MKTTIVTGATGWDRRGGGAAVPRPGRRGDRRRARSGEDQGPGRPVGDRRRSTGAVGDLPPAAWIDQLTVNLVTAAEVTRCALPALRRSRGHVVFVNFWDAHGVLPGWGPFAATKFGLRALAGAPRDARVVERAVTMASPSAAR